MYYETPYYIAPEKSGVRAYALLKAALMQTGKVGIATFVMRNKEHLAILKATDDVMILNRLRFSEEIRDVKELELPAGATVKPAELKMAISLINQLAGDFNVATYKDTYTEELLKLIKAKAKGSKPAATSLKVVHSKAKDLMAQLKESLIKSKKAS